MLRREHGETRSVPITVYGIIQDGRRSSSSQSSHQKLFCFSSHDFPSLSFFFLIEGLDPLCHLVRQPAASVFFSEVPLVQTFYGFIHLSNEYAPEA